MVVFVTLLIGALEASETVTQKLAHLGDGRRLFRGNGRFTVSVELINSDDVFTVG